MDAAQEGLQCGWAGCPEEFDDEAEWIKHVAIHVFTLKPDERVPWLGLPETDPDRKLPAAEGAFFLTLHTTAYSTQVFGTPTDDKSAGVDGGAGSAVVKSDVPSSDPMELAPPDAGTSATRTLGPSPSS